MAVAAGSFTTGGQRPPVEHPEALAGDLPVRPVTPPTPPPTSLVHIKPKAGPLAAADRAMFEGLGAWVDLFDIHLDHRAITRRLAQEGVRTLYLQTGRSNSATQVEPGVGKWLAAAHAEGLKVVGWYLPFYAKVPFDVERAVAIARFRYKGHAFDGVGIDIEYRAAVRGPLAWNARVVRHMQKVRERLGDGYPIAAIPPTPLQMRVAPGHWAGFPWAQIAAESDALLLMSYWSDRSGCPAVRHHCPYEFTRLNVQMARELSGRDDIVIHVIGGVGDSIDRNELRAFIRGAAEGAADGASIYDVRTTRPDWWRDLRTLKDLGS
jgi:hypothetical protein